MEYIKSQDLTYKTQKRSCKFCFWTIIFCVILFTFKAANINAQTNQPPQWETGKEGVQSVLPMSKNQFALFFYEAIDPEGDPVTYKIGCHMLTINGPIDIDISEVTIEEDLLNNKLPSYFPTKYPKRAVITLEEPIGATEVYFTITAEDPQGAYTSWGALPDRFFPIAESISISEGILNIDDRENEYVYIRAIPVKTIEQSEVDDLISLLLIPASLLGPHAHVATEIIKNIVTSVITWFVQLVIERIEGVGLDDSMQSLQDLSNPSGGWPNINVLYRHSDPWLKQGYPYVLYGKFIHYEIGDGTTILFEVNKFFDAPGPFDNNGEYTYASVDEIFIADIGYRPSYVTLGIVRERFPSEEPLPGIYLILDDDITRDKEFLNTCPPEIDPVIASVPEDKYSTVPEPTSLIIAYGSTCQSAILSNGCMISVNKVICNGNVITVWGETSEVQQPESSLANFLAGETNFDGDLFSDLDECKIETNPFIGDQPLITTIEVTPNNGEIPPTVSGTVNILAQATDYFGVTRMTFKAGNQLLDDITIYPPEVSAERSVSWETPGFSGNIEVGVTAYNANGWTDVESVTVNVDNSLQLTIIPDPTSVGTGKPFTISGRLTEAQGTGIDGVEVCAEIASTPVIPNPCDTTSGGGYYSIPATAPNNPGSYDVTVNAIHNYQQASNSSPLIVTDPRSGHDLAVTNFHLSKFSVEPNGTIRLYATFDNLGEYDEQVLVHWYLYPLMTKALSAKLTTTE